MTISPAAGYGERMSAAVHYVEIVTKDVAAARASYERAHGWRFEPAPQLGGAVVARLPDGSRFGIRAPLRADEHPVVRTYLRVDDLARAVASAREIGAEIAIDSMEIPGEGTIAIYLLGGIEQGLWQPPRS